ncbi:MAG: polysaccharide pyruvyl transferase family protein [Pseudomonadota bacterium]
MTLVQPVTLASGQPAQSHLDVIVRLQGLIDAALAPSLAVLKARPYALLDVPDHGNVGDSAIWAGQMKWLQRNVGTAPAYVCDHRDPMEEVNANLDGLTLLLHGGGNFGDIWPANHGFREAVISAHPQSMILQFPQSLHFETAAALDKTAQRLSGARNLRILVRDHESFDIATAQFDCEVAMCPDMAFALGPLDRTASPDLDVLLLLRTDKEGTGLPTEAWPRGWEQADWLEDDPDLYREVLRETRVSALLSLNPSRMSQRARRNHYYNRLAEQRLARGVRQLSRARFVITDRLHVHIVSTLLGLPHCFLDNHYGKISRFSAAFATRWSDSYQARTLPEAVACARLWLERDGDHPT